MKDLNLRRLSRRLRAPDAVVSHRSAAATLGLGDLLPDVHEFYSRIRRRLRREDVRIRVRAELPREDWTVVRGLPVATARKIVADLLHDREDESAIAPVTSSSRTARPVVVWRMIASMASSMSASRS